MKYIDRLNQDIKSLEDKISNHTIHREDFDWSVFDGLENMDLNHKEYKAMSLSLKELKRKKSAYLEDLKRIARNNKPA